VTPPPAKSESLKIANLDVKNTKDTKDAVTKAKEKNPEAEIV